MTHQPNPPLPTNSAPAEALEVCSLGLVEFESLRRIQERLVFEISGREDRLGYLLVCEHLPVITMGREASCREIMVPEKYLRDRNIAVQWVPRGGGACTHAPGQLGIYLLLPLSRMSISVAEHRVRMETAIAQVCHEFRVPAKRRADRPGVWSREGQVALFGAAVRSGVSCYGMALNVCPSPTLMNLTRSNSSSTRMTSLQAMTRRPMELASVRSAVACRLAEQFGYDSLNYSTPSNKVRNHAQLESLS